MSAAAAAAVYEVRNAVRRYRLPRTSLRGPRRSVEAVRGVSFDVRRGETFGVVGESGSGKSTLVRLLLGLEQPDEGSVRYLGGDLRREVQVVFQDPVSSLDPRMRVRQIVAEPLTVMRLPGDHRARADELLQAVGLPPGSGDRYPHEFSGGQRQRIAIARALAPRPQVLLADEPVSALDVSVRAQILNLLEDLRTGFDLTLVLVSHDLSVVRHMCDRTAVMYLGEMVELGPTADLFAHPQHAYTKQLLEAIPRLPVRRRA